MRNSLRYLILVSLFTFLQCFFWFFYTKNIKPDFTITPFPPSKVEQHFLSFGDKEFLYRLYGFQLQNAGDTFGETIPLRNYDYEKLEKWFYVLDELNNRAEYVPSIVSFYYAQTQNLSDNKYIVKYLIDHADRDPEKNWRWYTEAAYITKSKLKDNKRAVEIGLKVMNLKNKKIPAWARTIPIFLASNESDPCFVLDIINVLDKKQIEELAEDKIFSADNGQHNFLLKVMLARIQELENDRSKLLNCLNRKKNPPTQ